MLWNIVFNFGLPPPPWIDWSRRKSRWDLSNAQARLPNQPFNLAFIKPRNGRGPRTQAGGAWLVGG
jgi:hypothetical protein